MVLSFNGESPIKFHLEEFAGFPKIAAFHLIFQLINLICKNKCQCIRIIRGSSPQRIFLF